MLNDGHKSNMGCQNEAHVPIEQPFLELLIASPLAISWHFRCDKEDVPC